MRVISSKAILLMGKHYKPFLVTPTLKHTLTHPGSFLPNRQYAKANDTTKDKSGKREQNCGLRAGVDYLYFALHISYSPPITAPSNVLAQHPCCNQKPCFICLLCYYH